MFKLTIKTDNAAFEHDAKYYELARILRSVADDIENAYRTTGVCHDVNGNLVGKYTSE